ncbi:endonuclease I family protein [Cytobacillus dafuensis]|uniref:Endonuclease I n=1 Tax=Cytobacillus dafuensis TaxID=1742359 RepID=A0A5B8YZY4_CYTDA|nr:endonuclease [Cytobacillus dafuensis]QED46292.1 endonuclease I [Cytobacillus dafuensis]
MEDRQTQAILLDNFNELEQSYRKDVSKSLATVKENTERIQFDQQLYYNEKQDAKDIKHYYSSVANIGDSIHLFAHYHELVKRTHQQQIPYFISKDQFLYTWVDMQPDGSVKSIYSGEHKDPKTIIEEDFETIRKKYGEFLGLLKNKKYLLDELHKKMAHIESTFKFNTEHIVPQSWFGGKEPMKGDLHHLFVCQPECNTARSNFPYDDFDFYVPESSEEKIQNHCGVANEGKFEPENGKGVAARAMLYFLLRYPKAIRKPFSQQIDLGLLISWNHQFNVTIHEKHRNRAIYRIQGNRNPFIDFPELAEEMRFQI